MAIKTRLPPLQARACRVPNKMAGGYVNCPHCKGRFWVDKAAPSDATPADAVTMATPPLAAPPLTARARRLLRHRPRATCRRSQPSICEPPPGRFLPRLPKSRARQNAAAPAAMAAPADSAGGASPSKVPDGKWPDSSPPRRPNRPCNSRPTANCPSCIYPTAVNKEEKEKKTSSLSPLTLIGILFGSVLLSIVDCHGERHLACRQRRRADQGGVGANRGRLFQRSRRKRTEALQSYAPRSETGPVSPKTTRPNANCSAKSSTCSAPNATPTKKALPAAASVIKYWNKT